MSMRLLVVLLIVVFGVFASDSGRSAIAQEDSLRKEPVREASVEANPLPQETYADSVARTAYLVEVPLPIVGDRADIVEREIRSIARSSGQTQERPLLVLKFVGRDLTRSEQQGDVNAEFATRGSKFESCLALSRFLTSRDASNIRTVAYLEDSVVGHALLPVLACEEIVSVDSGRLGMASIDEPVDPTIKSAYLDLATRRSTMPVPVVESMLETGKQLSEVGLADGSTRIVGSDELLRLKNESQVVRETTLSNGRRLALFSAQELRDRQWISRIVKDDIDLLQQLTGGIAWSRARVLPEPIRPALIELSGLLGRIRVNQVIRSLQEEVDSGNINVVVISLRDSECSLEEAVLLANRLDSLRDRLYSVAILQENVRGPEGLIAASCTECVAVGETTFGPEQKLGGGSRTVSERIVSDLASRIGRPASLLLALLSDEVQLVECIHQVSGSHKVFTRAELDGDIDGNIWLEKESYAPGDWIDQTVAIQYGLLDDRIESQSQYLNAIGIDGELKEIAIPWLETSIQRILANGWIPRILFMLGVVTLMSELNAPGLGAAGFLSALCFLGFFWVEGLNGNVEWLELLLFVAGILAIAIEFFVIPGFGIFGIGGFVMVIASVVLASQTFVLPADSAQFSVFASNVLWVALMLAMVLGLFFAFNQFLDDIPIFQKFALRTMSSSEISELQDRESIAHFDHLIGQSGITTTRLNPSGKAQFGRDLVQVVGDNLIDPGVPIRVVQVRGNVVYVVSESES